MVRNIVLFLLVFVLIWPVAAHSTSIYDSFEGADIDMAAPCPDWDQDEAYADRITQQTSVVREGSKAIKFIHVNTDPEVVSGPRAELSDDGTGCPLPWNTEVWFGISHYYVSGNAADGWEILTQIHQHSGSGSPPLSLRQIGDGNWGVRKISGTLASPSTTTYTLDSVADDGSEWQDWVVRVQFAASGILQVWKNGTLVVNAVPTAIGYTDDALNHKFRCGIYRGPGATPATITRYIDAVRVRNDDDGGSYAAVCPDIAPKAPTIVSPANGASGISTDPTVDYDAYQEGYTDAARSHITDAQGVFSHKSIQVQLSKTQNWAAPDEDVTNSAGDLTQCAITGLDNFSTYYIRARYINTAGVDRDFDGSTDSDDDVIGPWSIVTSFTVGGAPTPPGAGGLHLSPSGTGRIGLSATGSGKIGGLH